VNKYFGKSICISMVTLLASHSVAESDIYSSQKGDISDLGDTLQIAIPVAALAGSWWIDDDEGLKMYAKAMVTNGLIVHSLKLGMGKLRPDASTHNSFPSGHTAAAFGGASYIYTRYGSRWGVPAYGAAAFVGGSRIWANRHFMDDVIAGASIATLSTLYWVEPHESALTVNPSLGEDSLGVEISFNPNGKLNTSDKNADFDTRYVLSIGGASTRHNKLQSEGDAEFDLLDFDRNEEPNTFASISLEHQLYNDQQTIFTFTPYEARDTATLSESISFGGETYTSGEDVISAYKVWSMSAEWKYMWLTDTAWVINTGASVVAQYISADIDLADGGRQGSETDWRFYPLLTADVGYYFTPKLSFTAQVLGISLDTDDHLEYYGILGYRFNERWDSSVNYGSYQHESTSSNLNNDLEYDVVSVSVGYSF